MLPAFLVLLLAAAIPVWSGPGMSTDSAQYLYAAETFRDRGQLSSPVTVWSSPIDELPYYFHGPLLPMALGGASWLSGLPVPDVARWFNAACFALVGWLTLSLVGPSWPVRLLVVAVLAGPAMYPAFFWLLSEPLYVALLALALRVARADDISGPTAARAAAVGAFVGLSVLVRYVGFFAAPVGALLLLGAPGPRQTRLTRAGAFLLSFVLVCGPWFLYLGLIGQPPRHIAVHTAEFWPQLKYQLSSTIYGWVLPLSVQPGTRLVLLLLVALVVAAVWLYRRSVQGAGRLSLVASSLALGYVAFVFAARLLADQNIPFDNRMFGPAALLLTIAIAAWLSAGSASAASITAVITAAAWFAVIGGRESVRALSWAVSEPTSLPALYELPPGARIYSNSPRDIVLHLRRPVKLTPALAEWGVAGRYRQQLGSDPVAALVLFPQGWPNLIPRDELLRALGLRPRADPAEPMVFVLTSGLPTE